MRNKLPKNLRSALKEYLVEEDKVFKNIQSPYDNRSEKYKNELQALIDENKTKKPSSAREVWVSFSGKKKVLLIATITILLIALTACAAKIITDCFIINDYDGYSQINFENTNSKDTKVLYSPTYITHGYVSGETTQTSFLYKEVWTNETDESKKIVFQQSFLNSMHGFVDTDNADHGERLIENTPTYYSRKGDLCKIYWMANDYYFYISCPNELSWEEVEKIVISVTPMPSA